MEVAAQFTAKSVPTLKKERVLLATVLAIVPCHVNEAAHAQVVRVRGRRGRAHLRAERAPRRR